MLLGLRTAATTSVREDLRGSAVFAIQGSGDGLESVMLRRLFVLRYWRAEKGEGVIVGAQGRTGVFRIMSMDVREVFLSRLSGGISPVWSGVYVVISGVRASSLLRFSG